MATTKDGLPFLSMENYKNELIPDGWHLGLTQQKTTSRPRKMWITNGIKTVQINQSNVIPNGFWKGRSDIHKK